MGDGRAKAIADIERAIGRRRLVWFGTRCIDALPLLSIPQFAGAYGLIAPLDVPSFVPDGPVCLEQLTGQRVDLNAYGIDDDRSPEALRLLRTLVDALEPGTVVTTYRPTAFLASAYYPRLADDVEYLGLFHAVQAAFEHKPWVETELSHTVRAIPWSYYADIDLGVLDETMGGQPCVIRANYSDGGIGLRLVPADKMPRDFVPEHTGGFIGAARYLVPNFPMNVSGCVFPDGRVTARAPSIQLIGVDTCTTRQFGYCGNDFAAPWTSVGPDGLQELDTMVRSVGTWLHSQGYRGAFGIDALFYEGHMWLTEINPRFQGSSAAGAKIAAAAGLSDLYLDHLASFLGLGPADDDIGLVALSELQASPEFAHSQVVCYNTGPACGRKPDSLVPDLPWGEIRGAPDMGVEVVTEAMLYKLLVPGSVTSDGFSILDSLKGDIRKMTTALFEES